MTTYGSAETSSASTKRLTSASSVTRLSSDTRCTARLVGNRAMWQARYRRSAKGRATDARYKATERGQLLTLIAQTKHHGRDAERTIISRLENG